jgi:hypothetical protein
MGMAKPLGFGSVRVDVVDLQVLDISARYTSSEDDGWRSAMTKKETYKDSFREAMEEAYDVDRFSRLINIYDLMTLLSDPPDLPIHYPRTTPEPTAEGKNFEWFMGNSRGGRRNPGPRLVLPLAPYDNEGFPLLDKYGNEPS